MGGMPYAKELVCTGWGRRRRIQTRYIEKRKKNKLRKAGVVLSVVLLLGALMLFAFTRKYGMGVPDSGAMWEGSIISGDNILPGNAEASEGAENTAEGGGTEGEWVPANGSGAENGSGSESGYPSDVISGGDSPSAAIPEETQEHIPLIVIDPGHGGMDEGCSGKNTQEKDINLAIAQLLADKLTEKGYQVILTRETDKEAALEERVELAQEKGADIFVSIHQNACEESAGAKGIETWCQTGADEASLRLARLIHKYAVKSTGADDRSLQQGDLYVTRESNMPSCLIETGFLSNTSEEQQLADPQYQEKLAEGIATGIGLYFEPRTMYLTFDDGPSKENTEIILDILAERGIKATFFVVGENVRKYPEVVKRIAAEGHTIGIHCDSHRYDELYESVESYLEDFEKAWRTVYEVTGVEAKLFRFPGGSINSYNKEVYEEIIEEMTQRGYIYYDWNASLEDAVKKSDPQQLIQNACESTLGRKKVVMLAHDIITNTALCLEELLDQLPEYRMKALTEEVEPIQF